MTTVRLRPLDEGLLESLLAVAVADAEPIEVMPPVPGPPGWTAHHRDAFRTFYRDQFTELYGPHKTTVFAILVDDEIVGTIRLTRRDEPGTAETGMWLGRSTRGQGIGTAALRALLTEAATAGMRAVVAETTTGNLAAQSILRRCGAGLTAAPDSDQVRAVFRL